MSGAGHPYMHSADQPNLHCTYQPVLRMVQMTHLCADHPDLCALIIWICIAQFYLICIWSSSSYNGEISYIYVACTIFEFKIAPTSNSYNSKSLTNFSFLFFNIIFKKLSFQRSYRKVFLDNLSRCESYFCTGGHFLSREK